MKLKTFILSIALSVASVSYAVTQGNGTITVKTSKLMRPLAEQWVKAYKTVHPEVNIVFVNNESEANLVLGNTKKEGYSTNVGRMAIMPVTPDDNPLIQEVQKKEWAGKDLKRLFFVTEEEQYEDKDRLSNRERLASKLTVISGSSASSSSQAFAKHFGFRQSDIKGKRIAGDDIFLLNAIEKNKQSVTFNSLSYIFNTSDRRLKPHIALLPLDFKKDQKEALLSGNLDKTLDELERQIPDLVVVDAVAFSYNTFNTDIDNFLQWVLSDGQGYNHKAGFLRLAEKEQKAALLAIREK